MVVLDPIMMSTTLGVAPAPAGGYACVEKVSDVAVRDGIIGAVADPHTNRMRHQASSALYDAVVD